LLHVILHRRDVELKSVDSNTSVVAENYYVAGMLWIYISDDVAPCEESEHCFSNAGVDGRAVSCVPDNKCVITADTCKVAVIRTEGELQHAVEHSF